VFVTSPAAGADSEYCKFYSREMVRDWVLAMPEKDWPSLTVDMIAYRLNQYWTHCLNSDEPPVIKNLPSDGEWTLRLWKSVQKAEPPGSVPASGPPDPPSRPAKPAAAPLPAMSGTPQPLCVRNHMKTIYLANHKSWRCRK